MLTVFVAVALDPLTRGTLETCTEKYSFSMRGHAPLTTHVCLSSVNVFKWGSPNKAHSRYWYRSCLISSLNGVICSCEKFRQAGWLVTGPIVAVVLRTVLFIGSETFPQFRSFIILGMSVEIVWKYRFELQLFTFFFTSLTQRKWIARAVHIAGLSVPIASTVLWYGVVHRSLSVSLQFCSAVTNRTEGTNKITSNMSVFIFTSIATASTLPFPHTSGRLTFLELHSRCGNKQADSSAW